MTHSVSLALIRPHAAAVCCVFLAVACLLLAGCDSVPTRDPDFSAVRPVPPPPPDPTEGAIFQPGYELVLFEDVRARRVGDILTVILEEETEAFKEADTVVQKESDTTIANPTILGTSPLYSLPGVLPLAATMGNTLETRLASSTDFGGGGESSQSNRIGGTISVTVAEVLPNGDLAIQGEKIMTLNQGSEHVRVSGVVRQADVGTDNTISSRKIANAMIVYAGEGAIDDANTMGWLARFFSSRFFPF
jgi:flagellar L-ring protein precursor FlgH